MGKIWMPGGGGGADLDVTTATAPDVLAGKVIVDKDGEPLTGTMPNRGAVSQTLNAGASYTIPAGYHNGSGTVAANSLASQTSATATVAQILSGQTAWVNGSKLTGNMPNYSTTPTPIDAIRMNNSRFEVAVAAGYHGYSWANNGYEYMSYDQVANAIGLTPAKLKKGEWVCGRTGTWEGYVASSLDLYNRGAWGSISSSNLNTTWSSNGSYQPGTFRYDSAQIALVSTSTYYSLNTLITKSFNTINYSNFNVTMLNATSSTTQFLKIECGTGYQTSSGGHWEVTNKLGNTGNTGIGLSSETTITLSLSNINSTVYFLLSMYPNTSISANKDFAYIKRIWFS